MVVVIFSTKYYCLFIEGLLESVGELIGGVYLLGDTTGDLSLYDAGPPHYS